MPTKEPSRSKAPALPKTPAACADRLYTVRESRYGLNKTVKLYEEEEKLIKHFFTNVWKSGEQNGVTGRIATVELVPEVIVTADNWDKIYAFIVKQYTKAKTTADKRAAFAIMTKALSDSTVKEMWTAKVVIPGVGRMRVQKVSCTKRAAKGRK